MKYLVRTTLILVIAAALSLGVVFAQDDAADSAVGLVGTVVQYAEAGTFEDNGDGSFTLTLTGVEEYSAWMMSAPSLFSGNLRTESFSEEWSFGMDGALEATASLSVVVDDVDTTLNIILSEPNFDPEESTLVYKAVVEEIFVAEDSKDNPEAPEMFVDAVLFVLLDDVFAEGWSEGAALRSQGTRDSSSSCNGRPKCEN